MGKQGEEEKAPSDKLTFTLFTSFHMFSQTHRSTRGRGKEEVGDSDDEEEIEEKEDDDPDCLEDEIRAINYVVDDSHQIRIRVTFEDVNKAEDAMKLARISNDVYGWKVYGHPKNSRVLKCSIGFTSHVIPTIMAQLDPSRWGDETLNLRVSLSTFPQLSTTFHDFPRTFPQLSTAFNMVGYVREISETNLCMLPSYIDLSRL